NLLRLFRLLRYRARNGAHPRVRHHAEFQPAVFGGQPGRVLAPMAHQPFDMAAGLSLHSFGWQSARARPRSLESDDHNDIRRLVAWRALELRSLGSMARPGAGSLPLANRPEMVAGRLDLHDGCGVVWLAALSCRVF